jgi:hypothetical protein
MAGAHQTLEHAEHAAHSDHGHDHGARNKHIGVTMACIGALIAFCAAMVGSERNELTRTMMEQTQAHSDYAGASVKFRAIMIELEKQRGKLVVLAENNAKPAGALDMAVVKRFLKLAVDYSSERDLSKRWSDAYKPLVDAHFDAAERYETAQLIAELGIVLASLAVLLGSRPVWIASMILAGCCIAQLAITSLHTRHTVQKALGFAQQAEEDYQDLRKRHVGTNEDAQTLDAIDPGSKIRNAGRPAEPGGESPKPAKSEAPHEK